MTLTLSGNNVQDVDGIYLEIERGGPGEMADLRGGHYVAPGRLGRVLGNRVEDLRLVTLRGFVTGSGVTEDAARADFVNNCLALEGYLSINTEVLLVAGLSNGQSYALDVLPVSSGAIVYNQIVPSMALVVVELESIAVDWVSVGS